ncbi:MAG: choice-of-anchor B family protein, partial [Saprospiraceae bacterium]|nr:choice-of-anchor B family protein [Saprospiraceae bacterium]
MKKLLFCAFLPVLLLSASQILAQNYNLQLRSTLDFPGQTLANVCGYAQDGREYALVGASQGLAIVEITNPSLPVLLIQIPGPNNLWKEIKTYSHYAYITSEGGQGLQIVDLSALPDTTLDSHFYTGDGLIEGQLDKIHALHIDTTKGFLYAYGGDLFGGGAKVFDLNTDPYNPTFAGKFDQLNYVHDGFVDNDTLYACHINDGILSIVDMQDKSNPELLGTVETPARFTHNSWLLSDRKHILTTDEKFPSFVTAYDISDPTDIQETDRIATTVDGNSAIGHNTHILNDWAITSYYVDGVTIVDAHRPSNLIQVGRYDTYLGEGQFDGCWGVYPYFPSGAVIASNIPNIVDNPTGKLFVLTPTYVRACYLEGSVKSSCTDQALIGVTVTINSDDPLAFTETKNDGSFKTGQPTPGNFTVTISKDGFIPQTIAVELAPGAVTDLQVILDPVTAYSIVGTVLDAQTGAVIPNVPVSIASVLETYTRQTN